MDKPTPLDQYKMQPAFPIGAKLDEILPFGSIGMSKLEFFTAMALSGIDGGFSDHNAIDMAMKRANGTLEKLYEQQPYAIVPTSMDK